MHTQILAIYLVLIG